MRERMLRVLRKGHADVVPWAPRWDLFFQAMEKKQALPKDFKGKTYFECTRALGMGITAPRCEVIKRSLKNVDITSRKNGDTTYTEYATRYGTVSTIFRRTPELEAEGVRGVHTKHMIERKRDFDVVRCMIENTQIETAYDAFQKIEESIGNGGIAFAKAGYCPFHDIMRNYMGYEKAYYALQDYPNQIEGLMESLEKQAEIVQKLIVESPAEIITCDGHFDGKLTPPPIYQRYFLPYLHAFSRKVHAAGKYFASHTDADMTGLLELFLESGFDIAEAFTPPPMCRVSIKEARETWKDRVTIWGGIASVMLSSSTPEETFREHMHTLFDEIAPGKRIILAVGDNVPTDSTFERLIEVGEIVKQRGNYPVASRVKS